MAKITYENKVALNVNSDIADVNKCNATDLNEIKNVVNENDDNTTTNTNDIANNTANIGTLSNLNTTNKNNLVSAINEIVVESGTNANGSWLKYANGIMICIKKVKFTQVVINTEWGSVYETANTISFGDYAQEFIEIPNVSITLFTGSTCFCETFSGRTKKSIGSTWLWKPAAEAGGNMTFDIIAIGRWK